MSVDRLSRDTVRTGAGYEAGRGTALAALSLTQSNRRVRLGDELGLVFESPATLRAALEELLRVERREDAEVVAERLAMFEAMAPGGDALLATLIVDSADAATLSDAVAALREAGTGLALEIAGDRVAARVHPGEDLGSGALSVVFGLAAAQREAWSAGAPVRVVFEGAAGRLAAELTPVQRAAVAVDLGVAAPAVPGLSVGDG